MTTIQPNKWPTPFLEAISKTYKAHHEPLEFAFICRFFFVTLSNVKAFSICFFNDVSKISKLSKDFNMISRSNGLKYLFFFCSVNFLEIYLYFIHCLKIINETTYSSLWIICHFILPYNLTNSKLWIFDKILTSIYDV